MNPLPPTLRRATDVEGIRERMASFSSPEGDEHARRFRPAPRDVVIATYSKSGTTWMQQIVHVLRGGDMDFEEITLAVPWIEMAYDLGLDLEAPQPGGLRVYKSHAGGDTVNPGARYIVVFRDPADVLVSFFRFFEGWVFEPGSIDLDTFTRDFFMPGSRPGDYWNHLLSWWERGPARPTLLLAYEELREDLPGMVDQIGDFLDIRGPSARRRAVELSSFEVMRAHKERFDDHVLRALRDPVCGLPPGGSSDKVASATTRPVLDPTLREVLADRWRRVIRTRLGFEDYADLLQALPAERARRITV